MSVPPAAPILYRSTIPPANKIIPLIVSIHAGGGTPAGWETNSRWTPAAEANGWAIVYPGSQTVNDPNNLNSWSHFQNYIDPVNTNYLRDNIPIWCATLKADIHSVWLTGFSTGGVMSLRMAFMDEVEIAGIAPSSGWERYQWNNPPTNAPSTMMNTRTRPVKMWSIHGALEATAVPLSVPTQSETSLSYATINGCGGASTNTSTVGPLFTETWPCSVSRHVVANASHCYQGALGNTGVCAQVDATTLISTWIASEIAASKVFVDVVGATGPTYPLTGVDVGHRLQCVVTANSTATPSVSVISNPVGPVT